METKTQLTDTFVQRPENHMVKAILTMIFCCLPFGVVSLIYSMKVNDLWSQGLNVQALQASKDADKWANIALICGLVWIAIYSIIILISVLANVF